MDFSAEAILARMKAGLKNDDTKMEGSFSMDNLQAVAEELARLEAMRIAPLIEEIVDREDDMGTSGNERHYVRWAKEAVDSQGKVIVGNAKVNALRDGTGHVSIAILTVDAVPPSQEELQIVQDYIDSMRPIGAEPEVIPAEGIEVVITCTLAIKDGYSVESVNQIIEKDVASYFTEIAFQRGMATLNYHKVSNVISSVEGVLELDNLEINGEKESITAVYDKYFMLKELIVNVAEQ